MKRIDASIDLGLNSCLRVSMSIEINICFVFPFRIHFILFQRTKTHHVNTFFLSARSSAPSPVVETSVPMMPVMPVLTAPVADLRLASLLQSNNR